MPLVSLAMEAIGDITASAEVSRVEVEGEEFDSRIQGGVLGDGIGTSSRAIFPHSQAQLISRWFAQRFDDQPSSVHLCSKQRCRTCYSVIHKLDLTRYF